MAIFRPFKGFRPVPALAKEVAARPYDVLNSDEARVEVQGHPNSFLHVGKPEVDLPPGTNLYDEKVYQQGKANLSKLIAEGVLVEDKTPAFYLYSQKMGGHIQYGLVGCASVQEYLNDTIKKHEFTRKDKEDDRTKHVKVTNAHSGPIFLTYRAQAEIDRIVNTLKGTKPTVDFVADDGIGHQLWPILDETTIKAIESAFAKVPFFYVADGHHRSAAAARVGKERADANPNHNGSEEYNFFLAVLFPHNQLRIMDYNRVVKDLNGQTVPAFLDRVREKFSVAKATGDGRPAKKGEIGMYVNHTWYSLTANPELLRNTDPVEVLDVSLLQTHLLTPVLGVDDPRTNKRIDFIGGIRGLKELEKRVNSGEMAVAFALHPTSLDELIAIADAGKIMPPKSTWFEPKLRDGMVVHFLD